MMMFVSLLLIAAAAQMLGGILSWFLIERFYRSIRTAIFAEIAIMLIIVAMLIEEGLRISSISITGLLIGIIAVDFLNRVVPHKHQTKAEKIGFLAFIAMCFHEFPEGVAFGAAYLIDPGFGLLTAFMMALHHVPEGSIVSVPYFIKKRFARGFGALAVTASLYTAGGLVAYSLIMSIPLELRALSMTFAAGAMLYIVAEEFLWSKCVKG